MKLPRITSADHGGRRPLGPGWDEAAVIETFYEIQPGDNIAPPVKTIARIGYDDKFFYASFWCEDPDISKIRAPYVDRDGITDDQDYVGILLDVENAHRAAIDFWIGPRGIQADSVFNEATVQRGLRPGLLLAVGRQDRHGLAGRPRSRSRSPRCATREGPAGLGADAVPRLAARVQLPVLQRQGPARLELLSLLVGDGRGHRGPAAGRRTRRRAVRRRVSSTKTYPGRRRVLRRRTSSTKGKVGLDAKWLPDAGHDRRRDDQPRLLADRVRRRADRASTSASRSSTRRSGRSSSSRWTCCRRRSRRSTRARSPIRSGARGVTGRGGHELLHRARDRRPRRRHRRHPGPGLLGRRAAGLQVLSSASARLRQDLGDSFAGLLGTARVDRGRRLQLRRRRRLPVAAQRRRRRHRAVPLQLHARARTGRISTPAWTGQKLSGFGWTASWTPLVATTGTGLPQHDDFADGFRADDGFVPQVGYREETPDVGYRFYPTGFFSRLRPLGGAATTRSTATATLISRKLFPGVAFQALGRPARRARLQLRGRSRSTGRRSSTTGSSGRRGVAVAARSGDRRRGQLRRAARRRQRARRHGRRRSR